MKNASRKYVWPLSLAAVVAVIGAIAAIVALTTSHGSIQAQDGTAALTVNVAEAKPGDTITVRGSGFRPGTEASFIYASTITIGGVPVANVASADLDTASVHGGRTTDSGLYIAEHIDIDPAGTTPDGEFIAEFTLPYGLSAGKHEIKVTSCWGGADESYPQDGVAPCGTVGLGGGVNDRVATASITVPARTPMLTVDVGEAWGGDTITVRGSGFRAGTEASFIYSSTITVGGRPVFNVASADLDTARVHAARTAVAEHIDIDPAGTNPDGVFIAEIALPSNLSAGPNEIMVTSCWGGPDESYPEDGVAPCGTVGLGGGVNDDVATATVNIR